MKTRCLILVGIMLAAACAQPRVTELPTVTPAPTSQTSATSPTALASPTLPASPAPSPTEPVSPTPTDEPFVLPGGRLLLAVGWASGGKYPDTDVDFFEQYRWLELPGMTVSPHPLLAGDYPTWDDFVTVTL